MSVLARRRSTSKAEFINTACEIYTRTVSFLSRLSARYSRLVAADTARLAGEVMDQCEKANSIYPSDGDRKKLRRGHLLEARASLMALDVRLTHVYMILSENPQGAFEKSDGRPMDSGRANHKLDGMAQTLGELIDRENALIKGAMKGL